MTISSILTSAKITAGRNISNEAGICFANEAQELLMGMYDSAFLQNELIFTAGDSNRSVTVNNMFKLKNIYSAQIKTKNYTFFENIITFSKNGQYKIVYLTRQQPFANAEDTLQIDRGYFAPMSKYIAAKAILSQNSDDRLAQQLLREFYEDAKNADEMIRGARRRIFKIFAPKWR